MHYALEYALVANVNKNDQRSDNNTKKKSYLTLFILQSVCFRIAAEYKVHTTCDEKNLSNYSTGRTARYIHKLCVYLYAVYIKFNYKLETYMLNESQHSTHI